jgi:hypothetical protein
MASGSDATVAGGNGNTASGTYGFVAGGAGNTASAYGTFAAGILARADGVSCAVFSLWNAAPGMPCFGISGIFLVGAPSGMSFDFGAQRGDGGGTRWVAFGRFGGQTISTYTGAYLSDGGAWVPNSDRKLKTNFANINAGEVLAKVAQLPITTWSYQAEDASIRHLGPTAQDFHAAFGIGYDDKHIADVDEGGVALAAIQGLHQVVQEKDARIAALEKTVEELKRAVEALAAKQ